MTCIVAMRDLDGRFIVGSDTRGMDPETFRYQRCEDKVFVTPSRPILIGVAGSYRVLQILKRTRWNLRQQDADDVTISNVIDTVRNTLQINGIQRERDGVPVMPSTSIVVAFNTECFVISEDYSAHKASEYCSIGSGSDYALGAIHCMIGTIDVRELLVRSLKTATTFDASVGGPFLIHGHDGRKTLVE